MERKKNIDSRFMNKQSLKLISDKDWLKNELNNVSITQIAINLGIERMTVYTYIKKHGLVDGKDFTKPSKKRNFALKLNKEQFQFFEKQSNETGLSFEKILDNLISKS